MSIDTLFEQLKRELEGKIEDATRLAAREKILEKNETTFWEKDKQVEKKRADLDLIRSQLQTQQHYIDKQNAHIRVWQGNEAKLEEKRKTLQFWEEELVKRQRQMDDAQKQIDLMNEGKKELEMREIAIKKSHEGLKIQREELALQQEANRRQGERLQQIADSLQPK